MNRWGVAVVLQLLMVIPAMLMVPLMNEYLSAIYQGVDVNVVFAQSQYVGQFLWGFFGTIFFGVLATTAMMIAFASKTKISLAVALTSAVHQYIPVLYTSFLAGLAVVLALIPVQLLNYWYATMAYSGLTIDGSAVTALRAIMTIALVALMIPALIVVVWVMYAPLAVALKETAGGFTAIMFAKHKVHKHVWQIVWRMVGAIVLFQIVTISVSTLPVASFVVPFVMMILIIAFFVGLYKEIRA